MSFNFYALLLQRSSIRNTPKKSIRRSSTRRTPVKIAESSPIKDPKPVENEPIKNTPINLSRKSRERLSSKITPVKSTDKPNKNTSRISRGSPVVSMEIIEKASINESIKGTKPRLSNRIAMKSVESSPTKNAKKGIETSPVTTPNRSIKRSSNRNSTLKNPEMLSVSNTPEVIEKVSINESINNTTPRKSNRISVKSVETLNAKKSIGNNPEVERIETSSVDKTPNKSIKRSSNRNSTLKNPEMLSVNNAPVPRDRSGGPSVSTSARRNIENSFNRTTPLNPVETSISNTSINSSISKQKFRKLEVVRRDWSSDEEEEIIFKDTSFKNSKSTLVDHADKQASVKYSLNRSERILVDPVDKQVRAKSSLNSSKRVLVDSADNPAGRILSFNTSKKKMVISVDSQAEESIATPKQKSRKNNTSGDPGQSGIM